MISGEPSQTALMVAVMRAYHHLNAPEPKILRDSVALSLSGLPNADALSQYRDGLVGGFTALSDAKTAEEFVTNIEHAVCMRSRVVEEHIEEGRSGGLKQLVILGAGLDSTAYRCDHITNGMNIIEIDHPATQAWKRERLTAAGVDIPENLRFVPFDFENKTLEQALTEGDVDFGAMTLFTWLGVHMYLTDETVKATLSILGRFPAGSELIMDFMKPDYAGEEVVMDDSISQLQKTVSSMGEPLESLYTEDELRARLNTAGFGTVDFLSSKNLTDEYFGGNDDAYALPGPATSILAAQI
ncbi:MAG: class I SAM-dependent methyltransferase [Maricaulaceae bacterium]